MGTFILILILLYFLPTIVAVLRGRRNKGAIFALNLFLGWSVAGWVVALVWALTHDSIVVTTNGNTNNTTASELQKLKELRDQGELTNEEFEIAKGKLLSDN